MTKAPAVVNLVGGVYRRIYAGFTRGRRINAVSVGAECLFWRLNVVADDLGNFHADPEVLKADAAPLRKWSPKQIAAMLAELVEVKGGLVTLYTVDGETYGHINDFETLQPSGKNGRRIQRVPAPDGSGGIRGNPGESGGNQFPTEPSSPSEHQTNSDTDSNSDSEHQRASEATLEGVAGACPETVQGVLTRLRVREPLRSRLAALEGVTVDEIVREHRAAALDQRVTNVVAVMAAHLLAARGQKLEKGEAKSLSGPMRELLNLRRQHASTGRGTPG